MSTKDLAHSVIGELGHSEGYRESIRGLAGRERMQERTYLRVVERDPEAADDLTVPVRHPGGNWGSGLKTAPLKQYLRSRIGQRWDHTFCHLTARFVGEARQFLDNQLSRYVAPNVEAFNVGGWAIAFYVDEHGVLRGQRDRQRSVVAPLRPEPKVNYPAMFRWLDNRKIGLMGARFVWFVPARTPKSVRAMWDDYRIIYAEVQGHEVVMEPVPDRRPWDPILRVKRSTVPYRQARLLTPKDEAFLRSLPENIQIKLLEAAPSNRSWGTDDLFTERAIIRAALKAG